MGDVILSDLDQGLLIIVSILIILIVIAIIYISCKRYSRLERRLWRDIEQDFVIIGSPAHMAEIKKSESDLSCHTINRKIRPSLLLQPSTTAHHTPFSSSTTHNMIPPSTPGLPQSPPPAYHFDRKSTSFEDGTITTSSLVDVKI
ncbi:hypothetical protein BDA99DRAFT_574605 [Phascolomyces articulosus]|uniref:Uncharacterized protein n=1 Tax=Phascolomyces articulosus TaxID=60185 RepID=A0AAD5JTS7_9FUNG|nr:hypothetical protein BDA99DRAFT_574605 [Phascolomyces articulosus]